MEWMNENKGWRLCYSQWILDSRQESHVISMHMVAFYINASLYVFVHLFKLWTHKIFKSSPLPTLLRNLSFILFSSASSSSFFLSSSLLCLLISSISLVYPLLFTLYDFDWVSECFHSHHILHMATSVDYHYQRIMRRCFKFKFV